MTKEERKEYNRNYYRTHRDQFKEYSKKHNNKRKEIWEKYYNTKRGRAVDLSSTYKYRDKINGLNTENNIDAEWIENNIFNDKGCIYCGEKNWLILGADRIDNTKGHTPDNVVCSCKKCNKKRNNKYSVEEFVRIMKEKGGA